MNTNQRYSLLSTAAKIATALALAVAVSVAMAQTFSIEGRTTSGGGGGVSAGGGFSVSGTTAGQPDTGDSSGGAFGTDGGFWAVVSVVQTPGAPPIAFRRQAGVLQVFWPLPDAGWELATTVDLTTWTVVPPATYESDDVNRFVRVLKPGARCYFRLYHPPPIVP